MAVGELGSELGLLERMAKTNPIAMEEYRHASQASQLLLAEVQPHPKSPGAASQALAPVPTRTYGGDAMSHSKPILAELPLQALRRLSREGRSTELCRLIDELQKEDYPHSIIEHFKNSPSSTENAAHPYVYPWEKESRDLGVLPGSPLVSIIIISYNSGSDLKSLLPTLVEQSYRNWELIIVENGQVDSRPAVNRSIENFKYIKLDNPGFAEANNEALSHAEGDLILLLNPDTRIERDTLKNLVRSLSIDANAAAACPLIYFYEQFAKIKFSGKRQEKYRISLSKFFEKSCYRKLFVRNGLKVGIDEIESDENGNLIIDLAIPANTSHIEFDLVLEESAPEASSDIYVDFHGSGIPPLLITATSNGRSHQIAFCPSKHSSTRYLINNAGSGIHPTGQPFDVGFGEEDHGQYSNKAYRDAFCGCSVLLRRDLFVKRKIFVSQFFAYYEDSELSDWIIKNKMKILYVPSSIVYHKHSESMSEESLTWKTLVNRSFRLYSQIRDNIPIADTKHASTDACLVESGINTALLERLKDYDSQVKGKSSCQLIELSSKPVIGIYNSYWSSKGGGEKHALDFAVAAKSRGYNVFLLSETSFSIQELGSHFGISLDGIKKLTGPVTESLTQRFDVFINSTYRSNLASKAQKSFYIVSFPHKDISCEALSSYEFLHNSEFTSQWARQYWGDHRSKTVFPILGFKGVKIAAGNLSNQRLASHCAIHSTKEMLILSIGRFNYNGHCKNQHIIARVFARLYEKGIVSKQWKLVIAGSYNESEYSSVSHYREVLSTLEGCNYEVYGNASRQKIQSLYQRSAIYVHATGLGVDPFTTPDKCEHFGISVFESILNGCIPIVYAHGGPALQVKDLEHCCQFTSEAELENCIAISIKNFELSSEAERHSIASKLNKHADSQINSNYNLIRCVLPSCRERTIDGRAADVDPGDRSSVNESPQPARLGRGLDHETHQAHSRADSSKQPPLSNKIDPFSDL